MQDHKDNRAAETGDAASRKQLAAPGLRVGPLVTVSRSCSGCAHVRSVAYRAQGDSGRDVYCDHPGAPEDGHVGDTRWKSPAWCPVAPLDDAARKDYPR